MKIWLAESFWESVRWLFRQPGDYEIVRRKLNDYANAGNETARVAEFERSHMMKRMKGCSFISKFYLRGNGISIKGTRVICIPLDDGRAERLRRINAGLEPQSGDSLLLSIQQHDLQGPEARRLERRFLEGKFDVCRIEPFPPSKGIADPASKKKRTVAKNAGLYVSKTPFKTYDDYVQWVENDEAKLSKDQFDILQSILARKSGTPTPFFVTGCAGSGKTLLAATVLNLLSTPPGLSNAYFVLSNRLCVNTADQTVRIALSKILWDEFSEAERNWIDNILDPMAGLGLGDRLAPETIADQAAVQNFPHVAEAMRKLPTFRTLNEYLFEELSEVPALSDIVRGRPFEKAFVDDARFRNWFRQNMAERDGSLRAPDVWTEIKGVITGYLGVAKALKIDESRHWNWGNNVFPVGQNERDLGASSEIVGKVWTKLENLGIAVYEKKGGTGFRYLAKADSSHVESARSEINAWSGSDRENGLSCMDGILRAAGFGDRPAEFVDHRKSGLTQEEYLRLPSEQSIHDQSTRRQIYQIYCGYEGWKQKNGLVDGNDLARIAAAWFSDREHKRPFWTVVVDECQDFTEMQLLAMKKLARNENGMILAGDQHQMINPTFFDPDRLQALFPLEDDVRLRSQTLSFNYRNTQQIAEFSNRIARKRKEWIGARGLAGELDERSGDQGPPPDFWTVGAKELSAFLDRQLEDPTFRVLVYDEADRTKVVDLAKDKDDMRDRVVTIRECKGLEYKKVLCYNLLGKHPEEWARIRAGLAKHDERYRYYFNSVYVAATRSLRHLGFLELDGSVFTDNSWLVDAGSWRSTIPQDAWPIDLARIVQDAFESGNQELDNALEAVDPSEAYARALRFYRQAEERWNALQPISLSDIRRRIAETMAEIAKCNGKYADEAVRFCLLHGGFWIQTKGESPLERLYESRRKGTVFEGLSERDIKAVIEVFSTNVEERRLLDELIQLQANAVHKKARDLSDIIR